MLLLVTCDPLVLGHYIPNGCSFLYVSDWTTPSSWFSCLERSRLSYTVQSPSITGKLIAVKYKNYKQFSFLLGYLPVMDITFPPILPSVSFQGVSRILL